MSKSISFILLGIVVGAAFAICALLPQSMTNKLNYERSRDEADSLRLLADSIMARFAVYDSVIANAVKADSTIKKYFDEKKITDTAISNDSIRKLLAN